MRPTVTLATAILLTFFASACDAGAAADPASAATGPADASLQAPGCTPFPTVWDAEYVPPYTDAGSPFQVVLHEEPLGEPDPSNPCTHDLEEPTMALTGHLGPPDHPGEAVSGLRTDDTICFVAGDSYGMQLYRATIHPEEPCFIDGSWSDHAGTHTWRATAAAE